MTENHLRDCPYCGAQHPLDTKTCPETSDPLSGYIRCSQCKSISPENEEICSNCGSWLESMPLNETAAEVPDRAEQAAKDQENAEMNSGAEISEYSLPEAETGANWDVTEISKKPTWSTGYIKQDSELVVPQKTKKIRTPSLGLNLHSLSEFFTPVKYTLKFIIRSLMPLLDHAVLGAIMFGLLLWMPAMLMFKINAWPWWVPIGVFGLVGQLLGVGVSDGFEKEVLLPPGIGALLGGAAGALLVFLLQRTISPLAQISQGLAGGLIFGASAIYWLNRSAERSKLFGMLLALSIGIGVGYLLKYLAPRFVDWLLSPVIALLIGLIVGSLVGGGWFLLREEKPIIWPAPGVWTVIFIFTLILGGRIWFQGEGELVVNTFEARRAEKTEDWATAWKKYQAVWERKPDYFQAYEHMLENAYHHAQACFIRQNWACAENAYLFIYRLEPQYHEVSTGLVAARVEPHYMKGIELAAAGQWQAAEEQFIIVSSIAPTYKDVSDKLVYVRAEPYYLTGRTAMVNQEWDAAIQALSTVSAIEPGYKDAAQLLTLVQHEKLYSQAMTAFDSEKWEEAITFFDKLLSLKPTFKDTQEKRAAALASYLEASYEETLASLDQKDWDRVAQKIALLRSYDPNFQDISFLAQQQPVREALQRYYTTRWSTQPVIKHGARLDSPAPITALAFIPLDNSLATGDADGSIWIWDAETGVIQQKISAQSGHPGGVNALATIPACRTEGKGEQTCLIGIGSAGEDRNAKLWNLETGELKNPVLSHSNPVAAISFSRDGERLATIDVSAGFRVWGAANGAFLYLIDDQSGVLALNFHGPNDLLAVIDDRYYVNIWDGVRGRMPFDPLPLPDPAAGPLEFSPEGNILAALSQENRVYLWDFANLFAVHTSRKELSCGRRELSWIVFFPRQSWLYALSTSGDICAWDISVGYNAISGEADWVTQLTELDGQPLMGAFSIDGWLFAVLTDTGNVTLYTQNELTIPK